MIDRRTEFHDPNWKPTRRTWARGDFEITGVVLEDVLLTI